ncbi:MAG: ribonucleoside triphosphate reductase [Candidatus Pacearchaeota archaeon]|jgi:ribonucleoside-triphosphate reductase
MVTKLRKRDGSVVLFQKDKIAEAIWKAVKAVGGTDRSRADYLGDLVVKKINEMYDENSIPDVEVVQDLVEKVLIEAGHAKTAKAYILYRQSHRELRDIKGLFDTIEAVDDYLSLNDWMVKENSNMGFSLQGLNNYIATKIISNYWMRRIYPEAIRNAHENADIHVHDLGTLGAYCVGWDLKDLLMTGFKGVRGKVECTPPKHLRTALGQAVNFFYTLQGETAGAQAFSNFDSLLAPFIRYDNLSYKEVKQAIQEFLFGLAVPTRVGFQTPFTNVTLDLKVPEYMKDEHVIIGGVPQKETYKEFQKEMDMFNKAFAEGMIAGDASGRVFTFPIPTYNITKDFDWENPEYNLIWEMTAKYGIPYFSNFINSDMKPEDARSMCCRLRLDQKELRKRGGGLFGANPQTGSIGVVTVNLPRLGFVSANEEDFFKRLGNLMELAKESLEIKRKNLERFTDLGLYPYSKFYLRNIKARFGEYWKNHFSTIGILGMNEAITNFLPGENITTPKGMEFSIKTLNFMREKLEEFQKETNSIYNLEATPGEGTTYRFARSDKKRFGRILVANETAFRDGKSPYYTNSTQLPVNYTSDLFEALELQDPLQTLYTGGTVFHAFIGEKIPTESVKILVKKVAENFSLPYFTITPTFSICPVHGYISGDHVYCPKCDCEIGYSDEIEKNTTDRASRTQVIVEAIHGEEVGDVIEDTHHPEFNNFELMRK